LLVLAVSHASILPGYDAEVAGKYRKLSRPP